MPCALAILFSSSFNMQLFSASSFIVFVNLILDETFSFFSYTSQSKSFQSVQQAAIWEKMLDVFVVGAAHPSRLH